MREATALGRVLVVLGAGGCLVTPAPVVMAPARGCDLAGRTWQQTSSGPCATSTWRFERRQDGQYLATETGCTGATGVARWEKAVVALDFQYPDGAGQYLWPLDAECRSSAGQVMWSSGPAVGQTAVSTLSPVR